MANWRYLVIIAFVLSFIVPNVSAGIYIFWNGTEASIPSGWTCQSCATGIDFFNLAVEQHGIYPKVSNNICLSDGEIPCGGSMSHSHTYTTTTAPPSSTSSRLAGIPEGSNTASGTHTHTSLNVTTTDSNSSVPLSYGLLILRASDPNEDTIPQGGMIWFNSTTPPSGFNAFLLGDGYFPLPIEDGLQNTIMGQQNHNHTNKNVKTGNPSAGIILSGTEVGVATIVHNHTVGNLNHTDNVDHIPPFVDIPLVYATSDLAIPVGAILMANQTTNWSAEWTKQNYSTWLGKYIRINSTHFNTTGGTETHNHTRVVFGATGGGSAGVSKAAGVTLGTPTAHTHAWVNVSTANADNNPSYSNITMFRLDKALTAPPASDCWWYDSILKILGIPHGCDKIVAHG